MGETTLTLRHHKHSTLAVSLGLKVSLIPGLTVSLGLPYRGRDRETETRERPGRLKNHKEVPGRDRVAGKKKRSQQMGKRELTR